MHLQYDTGENGSQRYKRGQNPDRRCIRGTSFSHWELPSDHGDNMPACDRMMPEPERRWVSWPSNQEVPGRQAGGSVTTRSFSMSSGCGTSVDSSPNPLLDLLQFDPDAGD
jgi:hypothetical protein